MQTNDVSDDEPFGLGIMGATFEVRNHDDTAIEDENNNVLLDHRIEDTADCNENQGTVWDSEKEDTAINNDNNKSEKLNDTTGLYTTNNEIVQTDCKELEY